MTLLISIYFFLFLQLFLKFTLKRQMGRLIATAAKLVFSSTVSPKLNLLNVFKISL